MPSLPFYCTFKLTKYYFIVIKCKYTENKLKLTIIKINFTLIYCLSITRDTFQKLIVKLHIVLNSSIIKVFILLQNDKNIINSNFTYFFVKINTICLVDLNTYHSVKTMVSFNILTLKN